MLGICGGRALDRVERRTLAQVVAAHPEREAALAAGDDWKANDLLRQYRLVQDGGRDPEDLLAEGMALIRMAASLGEPGRDLAAE